MPTLLKDQALDLTYTNPWNYLINGEFTVAQRVMPAANGAYVTLATNTYSADRWKTWSENASYQFARVSGASTDVFRYAATFQKITSAGKLMHYQIIESTEVWALRGKQATFTCAMICPGGARTFRMGVFQLTSAGATDTIPSPIVTSANANGTDPTMASNISIIGGAQSKNVGTSWDYYSVSITVPTNCLNLICAVWTDSQAAVSAQFYISQTEFVVGSGSPIWRPRSIALETLLCQRYCYVTPDGSAAYGETGQWNMAQATNNVSCIIPFPVTMRIAPTMTNSGNFRVDDSITVYAVTGLTQLGASTSVQRTVVYAATSGTPALTAFRNYKLSANNDVNAKMIFDAEL